MKKIDFYILTQFLKNFILLLVFLTLISLIVDIFENLNKFIDNQSPKEVYLHYYYYSLPSMMLLSLPISCLVASVFTFGIMTQNKEWLVLKSSGWSLYRLITPMLTLGILISVFSFYLDNHIVIPSNIQKEQIKEQSISKIMKKNNDIENIYFLKNEDYLISIEVFNPKEKQIFSMNQLNLDSNVVLERIDAKSASWKEQNKWNISNYSIRKFDKTGLEFSTIISESDTLIQLQFSLDDILSVGEISSEMTYKNLKKQISFLESNGINAKRWKVDLEYKIAYAFICFILVFCGIPISVYRSNTSLTQGIGISLGIVLSYIILLKLGQSLAYAGVLSPFIGVWLSNFIFLLLGIYLMLSARK